MTEICLAPIRGPGVWTGVELAGDRRWERRLDPAERLALEAGLAAAKDHGVTVQAMGRSDFPTGGRLRQLAAEILAAVRDGRGFIVIRGFPVDRFSDDDIRLMYWGLGLQIGTGLSQDGTGAG